MRLCTTLWDSKNHRRWRGSSKKSLVFWVADWRAHAEGIVGAEEIEFIGTGQALWQATRSEQRRFKQPVCVYSPLSSR